MLFLQFSLFIPLNVFLILSLCSQRLQYVLIGFYVAELHKVAHHGETERKWLHVCKKLYIIANKNLTLVPLNEAIDVAGKLMVTQA